MAAAPDPRAESIKRRKERKAEQAALRKQVRVAGILAAAKFFLDVRKFAREQRAQSPSLDCPECLKLQSAVA